MISPFKYSISPFIVAGLAAGCSAGPTATSAPESPPAAAAASATSPASAASTATTTPSRETATLSRDDWRRVISKTPSPKMGCFHASQPGTTWEEVPCGPAPASPRPIPTRLLEPAHASAPPDTTPSGGTRLLPPPTINGLNDYNASVSGSLVVATGSFPFETGGAESDNNGAATNPGANSYSLQMNTNVFNSAVGCTAGNSFQSTCKGWEQFIYDSAQQQGYIEFSLVNYVGQCPAPFGSNYFVNNNTVQVCYFNTDYVSPPGVAASNLTSVAMTVTTGVNAVNVPTDTLIVQVGSESYILTYYSELGLNGGGWSNAEFNVYGENNSTQATFNNPTTLQVQVETETAASTAAAPSCPQGVPGWGTAESNTLNLVSGSCCAFGGVAPGIRFTESNVSGATAGFVCPPAPKCSYSYACTGGGQISISCTPDSNGPSDPISIYRVVDGGTQQPAIDQDYFAYTYTTPTPITTISTVSSGLSSQTFVGCTDSSWGGQNCDPTPTTVSTPSCVGVSCGEDMVYDASGACVYVGSPCGTTTGYVINTNGQCVAVGSAGACGAGSIMSDAGYCVVIGSGCAINGDAPGVWDSSGQCVVQSITCPPGQAPAGPPGGQYCYTPGSGDGTGSKGGGSGGGGGGVTGGGSSGSGCKKCVNQQ